MYFRKTAQALAQLIVSRNLWTHVYSVHEYQKHSQYNFLIMAYLLTFAYSKAPFGVDVEAHYLIESMPTCST